MPRKEMITFNLSASRGQLGLTQEVLADLIGCHITTLQRWEQRRTCPAWMPLVILGITAHKASGAYGFDRVNLPTTGE